MPRRIISVFQEFYDKFCRVVPQNHILIPRHNGTILRFDEAGQLDAGKQLSLHNPIFFRDWPCKKYSGRVVDIVLDYRMVVRKTGGSAVRIVESSALVAYFAGGLAAEQPVQVFRFDYHPKVGLQAGDPLFHLQFDSTPVSKDCLPVRMRRHWPYQNSEVKPQFVSHVRVPTARMLLPDLLCFIVADHLRDGLVHILVKKAEDTMGKVAGFICDDSLVTRQFWDSVPASNWYCHCPQ